MALALHRKAKHGQHDAIVAPDGTGTHTTLQAAVDALPDGGRILIEPGTYHEQVKLPSGYLVTFLSGKELHVPAEEHQETLDRHWFFRGGALKQTFKRNEVAAVEVV